MAQVTVELGRLLNNTNFELFDFDYQFDDKNFKAQLEQAVIDFYYDYEIGQETPDMFKRKFKARWNRLMKYYNVLYNTTLLSYNPLTNYSVSEALEQLSRSSSISDSTSDSSSNGTSSSNTNTKNSDYPQQPIAGGDYLQGESSGTSDGTSSDSGHATAKTTGSDSASSEYTKTVEGLTGTTYPDLIEKHREALLRVIDMVIEELKPCFILVH